MKVKLTARFQKQFITVIDYITDNFGGLTAENYTIEAETKVNWVSDNPNIGRLEPLLADRVIQYRYLHVGKHNKMIYYQKGDTIYIVDLWDMRREPSRLAARIRSRKK